MDHISDFFNKIEEDILNTNEERFAECTNYEAFAENLKSRMSSEEKPIFIPSECTRGFYDILLEVRKLKNENGKTN